MAVGVSRSSEHSLLFHSYSLFYVYFKAICLSRRPAKSTTKNKTCTNTSYILFFGRPARSATRTNKCTNTCYITAIRCSVGRPAKGAPKNKKCTNTCYFAVSRCVLVSRHGARQRTTNARTLGISQLLVSCWSASRRRYTNVRPPPICSYSLAVGRPAKGATENNTCTNTCYFTAIRCFGVGRQGAEQRTTNARTRAMAISSFFVGLPAEGATTNTKRTQAGSLGDKVPLGTRQVIL